MRDTVEEFTKIAENSQGDAHFSTGGINLIETIQNILIDEDFKNLDLVLCFDTTQSMINDMDSIKANLVNGLQALTQGAESLRIGLVLYKDYHEIYLTRAIPFSTSWTQIQAHINRISVYGGRDIPEAVYEALYTAIHEMEWRREAKKMIILIGDAPPHPRPRGDVTKEMVYSDAQRDNISIHTIILPH